MTAEHWRTQLAPAIPKSDAFPRVVTQAKHILAALGPGERVSTAALVDQLWPAEEVHTEFDKRARQRIFDALKQESTRDLAAYNSSGETKIIMGKPARPRLWHLPEVKRCPHCGGAL
ncbi:MAG: hypothetical protein ACREQ5_02730 [Candidatus Dormibacteria bacterium]